MTALAEQVAAAFKAACLDELEAPKPGNVHVFASGHRMTAAEFVRSAEGGRARARSSPGARHRAQMGHAFGLPRISLRLSRQPYRPQARHRDGRGHMPRRVALSTANAIRRKPGPTPHRSPNLGCSAERARHQSRNKCGPHGRDLICPPAADHLAVGSQQ